MNHDVLIDKYARLYEQPYQLAALGNEVLHLCLSYRNCKNFDQMQSFQKGSIRWLGLSAGFCLTKLVTYPSQVLKLGMDFKPDLIVASSDCLHICLAHWLSIVMKVRFAADLYDDYETFGLSKLPFLKYFYRRALKQAKAISCVSQHLAIYIKSWVQEGSCVEALPSTIDKSIFFPRSKDCMKLSFNLPVDGKIIGTAGGLTKSKGIATVYDAALEIVDSNPDIHFAFAGPVDPLCPPPAHERIHYLGTLTHQRVAELFSALDVGIVYLRDTTYGKFSFPQKAYEMASCRIPMVVSAVGDMSILFSRENNELYTADNIPELVSAIQHQLSSPHEANLEIDDWAEHGRKLDTLYKSLPKD